MGEISEKEIAILGLLNEGPKHGYELERVIEERYMRYWTEIGFSSIYHILKQLEKKKLIKCTSSCDRSKRMKKVYSLTAAGKKQLKSAIRSRFSSCGIVSSPYLLSLVNLDGLTEKQLLSALRERRETIEENLAILEESMGPYKGKNLISPTAFYTWFRDMSLAEKKWLKKFEKEIREGKYR
jgi:DNA-binding PadR family transcriptional regulator